MSGIFWSVAEYHCWASLVAQMVKHLPAMQETRDDPWVWKIPWRRKWQPTPVLLPGKFHRQRSLVSYSPWGHKELDMTEQLHFSIIVQFWSIFVVQLLSHVWLFVTPWTAACKASLFLTVSWSLPKFMSIELVMLSTVSSSATLFSSFEHLNICYYSSVTHMEGTFIF